MTSRLPWPERATVSTAGQPVSSVSLAVSMSLPALRTSSIMFSASTSGTPSSMICTPRYRLRSRQSAFSTSMTAPGRSSMRKLRAAFSSSEYAVRE